MKCPECGAEAYLTDPDSNEYMCWNDECATEFKSDGLEPGADIDG